jgi:hypothetical protein
MLGMPVVVRASFAFARPPPSLYVAPLIRPAAACAPVLQQDTNVVAIKIFYTFHSVQEFKHS